MTPNIALEPTAANGLPPPAIPSSLCSSAAAHRKRLAPGALVPKVDPESTESRFHEPRLAQSPYTRGET
jgi:hypothetical protein